MKKFKNIRLMLVGLFCLMGMNAFALAPLAPDASNMIYKDGLVYIITDATATPQEVLFYGISEAAVTADPDVAKTLVLNNDVTAAAPSTGVNTQYKVVGFYMENFDAPAKFWYEAQGAGEAWATVALTSVEDIEFNLTLKELTTAQVAKLKSDVGAANDPASTIFKDEAWKPLTNGTLFPALKTFKLGDMRGVITLAEPLDIPNIKSHVTTIDLSGVMNDGIDPVTVPDSWAEAFSALESVTFPATANVNIGEAAFFNTPALATVTFGSGTVVIGDRAFRATPKLTSIDLTTVKEIGATAFQASGLTAVTITANVEKIGEDAFNAATNPQLKEVTFSSEQLTTVPAVFGLQKIEKVTVTGAATKIVANAFADATGIKEIHFENAGSLATVPATVFNPSDKALVKVMLRGSALTALPFAATALQNQTALTDFTFPEGLTGALPSFSGCKNLNNLGTIPVGVTSIPNSGFYDCFALTAVDFDSDASGLTSIGDQAFANDAKLKSFAFAKTKKLQTIGVQAFEYCEALESADLSGTMVKSIGNAAFRMKFVGDEWKTALATVSLPIVTDMTDPADATKPYTDYILIGANAFWGCADVTTIGNLNQPKLLLNPTGGQFAHSGLEGEIDLSAATHQVKDGDDNLVYQFTVLPGNAFYEATGITKVTLPVGVTTVGGYAFYGCEGLTEVVYNGIENLASIGTAAFQGCALTAVDLSGAIGRTADDKDYLFKVINPYTFAYNKSLVTVTLPHQINEIKEGAFFNDVALANINLNQTDITYLNTIFSDYQIAGTKEVTLSALKSLPLIKDETITLSINGEERGLNPLLEIEDMALQFTGLTEFTMPETVEYASSGFGIFRACTNLKKFTWKNAKENILGVNFFRGDVKLEEVYFLTKETCDDLADDEIFFMCDMDKLTVYVTKDSYNAIIAAGMGNDNRQYSTIAIYNNSTFQFTEKNLASDGYYYATYYDLDNSSWFDPEVFDVYSAVIDGSKIVLKPATVEGGYYKVARFDLRPAANFIWTVANDHDGIIDPSVLGDEDEVDYTAVAKAICVVRSQNIDAKPILNSNEGSEYASTLPTDNDLQYCWYDGYAGGSKLNFVYQLGRNKSGKVSFYRITSGDFKEGGVFVEAYGGSARAGLDIVIEGESTGINGIVEENVENDNAPIYNLQGVRVNSAKNGNLYIKNGKKFMK